MPALGSAVTNRALVEDHAVTLGNLPAGGRIYFRVVSEDEAGPALAFCGGCRIREECLSWALKNGERYGVWGGLTSDERLSWRQTA